MRGNFLCVTVPNQTVECALNDGCVELKEEALINLEFLWKNCLCWAFLTMLSGLSVLLMCIPRNLNYEVLVRGSSETCIGVVAVPEI